MNTNVSIIDNMVTPIAGAVRASSKPNTTEEAPQFSTGPQDNWPQVSTPETPKPDNTFIQTHDKAAKKPARDFGHTLRKTAAAETPPKKPSSAKPKEQGPSCGAFPKVEPGQPLLTQESPILTILPVKKAGAEIPAKPGASGKPARLIAANQAKESASVLAQSLGSAAATAKPGDLTPQALEAKNKSALLTSTGIRTNLKVVVPEVLKQVPKIDTSLEASKKPNKAPVLSKTLVDTKLTAAAVAAGSKTTTADTKTAAVTAGEKQIIAGTSASADRQETVELSGKTILAGEKISALSTGVPALQAKSSEARSRPLGVDPEKSVRAAEKPTDNKAAVPQALSEFSGSHRKESLGNHLSDSSTFQKLNAAQVHVSTDATKTRGSLTSNDNGHSNARDMLSDSNSQTPVTEKFPTSAGNAKPANLPGQTSSADVSAEIGKQILESIHSSWSRQRGDRQITVRLNPPELGKVFIRFREQDAQITGVLEVSRTQTRLEIEQALPEIIRNLANCGIQMKRFEVMLSDGEQSGQEALKDQSLPNGGTPQQNSANPGTGRNDPDTDGIGEWSTDPNSYQNISAWQEAFITDGSINILM